MAANEKKMCAHHPDTPAGGACNFCSQPLCRVCIRDHGLFCGPECKAKSAARAAARAQTEASRPATVDPEYEKRRSHLRLFLTVLAAAVLVTVGELVWKFGLDTTGKVAWRWECAAPAGGLRLVAVDPVQTVVRTPQGMVILDTQSGVKQKEFSVRPAATVAAGYARQRDETADPFQAQVRLLPGNLLLFMEAHSVCCYGLDGALKWDVPFPTREARYAVVSADGKTLALAAADLPPHAPHNPAKNSNARQALSAEERTAVATAAREYGQKLAELRETVAAYDVATGKELWTRQLEKGQSVLGLLAGNGQVVAAWHVRPHDEAAYSRVQAWTAADGQPAWDVRTRGFLQWGPAWAGERVLVVAASRFHAINPNGKEAYGLFASKNPVARAGGGLVLTTGAGDCLYAYDLASGKPRWIAKVDSGFLTGVTFTDTTVYVRGTQRRDCAPRPKRRLPEAEDDGTDAAEDDLLDQVVQSEIAGDTPGGRQLEIPYLIAIDSGSGKVKWATRAVHGEVFADAESVISLTDTGLTGIMEIVAGNRGEMLFKRFDRDSGKVSRESRDAIGLLTPQAAGKHIVGVMYDRSQLPGPRSLGGRQAHAPPRCLGIAALRAR